MKITTEWVWKKFWNGHAGPRGDVRDYTRLSMFVNGGVVDMEPVAYEWSIINSETGPSIAS